MCNHTHQTIVESLRAEGRAEGELRGALNSTQEILLRFLRKKFGKKIPARLVKLIQATRDTQQLDTWDDQVLDAHTLEDMGLDAKKPVR